MRLKPFDDYAKVAVDRRGPLFLGRFRNTRLQRMPTAIGDRIISYNVSIQHT
jgi:hypothetical protein